MKTVAGVVGLLVFCAGCVSDFGVYQEDAGAVRYKMDSFDVIPLFNIDASKPVIADQGRAALLGRWRVRINEDRVIFYENTANRLTGAKKQLEYSFSFWEYDEYDIREDGTYSMRRLTKDGGSVLKDSGEDGRWTYEDGVLRLNAEYILLPGMYAFLSSPERWRVGDDGITCRVKWLSQQNFSLDYVDPLKATTTKIKRPSSWWANDEIVDVKARYDDKGCLLYQVVSKDGRCSVAANPMRFKRVDK